MSCDVGVGVKKAFPAAVVLALLFSAVAGTLFVNLGGANPYHFVNMYEVSPDAYTEPPLVSILSPTNNTAYARNNVILSLNISVKYSNTTYDLYFWKIYYEADWQSGATTIYEYSPETGVAAPSIFNTTIDLSRRLPEGNHSVTVYATEGGHYEKPDSGNPFTTEIYPFKITGSSTVSFTIDNTPPKTSITSPENKIYDIADVPLNFTVNEPVSQISYVLDGQENVTIAGNTTLTGLSDGPHNIKVYAKDAAGNIDASEAVFFSVKVPFPTALVATASGASVAVIGVGLFVYFKKRNHLTEKNRIAPNQSG